MRGPHIDSILDNVEKHEEIIVAMLLWRNDCFIMILFIIIYVCRCSRSSSREKKLLRKHYCRDKAVGQRVEYNSFLWKVERPSSPPTYLFGTIHAPYNLVWRYIPMNAKDAFMEATHVYTEVDLKDSKVIGAIRKCRLLPSNTTLKDVLPPKLFDKLMVIMKRFEHRRKRWMTKFNHVYKEYVLQTSTLYNQYSRLKPVWLISTILQQWNKFFVKSQFRPKISLDSHLVQLSKDRGAYHGGIEDVSMHCDPMDNLSADKVNLALNVTIYSQDRKMSGKWKSKENDIRRVVNLYKCDDPLNTSRLGTLFSDFISNNLKKELEEIDSYLSRELILKRNVKMAARIDSMFQDSQYKSARMFFAVGAAHLLGNDSVVNFLRQKGYSVTHIKPEEVIPATAKRQKIDEETKRLYIRTMNYTRRLRKIKTLRGQNENPIVIIKRVQKTYVYYYNTGRHVVSNNISILVAFLILLIVRCFS